jgi:hypothetical protein
VVISNLVISGEKSAQGCGPWNRFCQGGIWFKKESDNANVINVQEISSEDSGSENEDRKWSY